MRPFLLLPILALCTGFVACSTEPTAPEAVRDGAEITEVNHTPVKDQPIGNCWIYAATGWVESLEQRVTEATPDYSEAYFTMEDWFVKVTNEFPLEDGKIQTGGSWALVQQELPAFGLMKESDFLASKTVAQAETAINLSLASGALSTPASRTDPELVMNELFEAFGVAAATRVRFYSGEGVIFPDAVRVRWPKADTLEPEAHTLGEALTLWAEVAYPSTAALRRQLQIRVQRAMHGGAPVVLSWLVDFNALAGSTFALGTVRAKGKGQQGGHMSLMYDYQANDVPGFGTLKAGELEARPAALEAALSPRTTIEFFRIKNSWGDTVRPGNAKPTDPPNGYYDLEQTYLDGPIDLADGTGTSTPLRAVVLPSGF